MTTRFIGERAAMSDDNQILIPDSFLALHRDPRGRPTSPAARVRERYDLCEDLAQQLVDSTRGIALQFGVAEDEVLSRCWRGLREAPSPVDEAEAGWIVTRLAELQGWPPLEGLSDSGSEPPGRPGEPAAG